MTRFLPAILLLTIATAFAQGPALQPADDVLAETLRRHGGGRLHEVVRIRLTGTSQKNQTVQPVVVSASMDGWRRIDYGRNGAQSSVTSPNGGFMVRDGKRTLRPSHAGVFAYLDMFAPLGLRNANASGRNRGFVGNHELKGAPTVQLRTGRDQEKTFYNRVINDEADVQLDTRTGLVAAVHRVQYADDSLDRQFTTSFLFSDYREVGGIVLPFRIERYQNQTLMETFSVENYEINPVFARDLFTR
jgi:hypothetical protein